MRRRSKIEDIDIMMGGIEIVKTEEKADIINTLWDQKRS
jgi:hypothetical protein